MWSAHPGMEEVGLDAMIRTFLYEPLRLVIEMDNVHWFEHPLFRIPLRQLERRELYHVIQILQQHHHNDKRLFVSNVNTSHFTVTYHRFQYNALLAQQIQRVQMVEFFGEHCMSLFSNPIQRENVQAVFVRILQKEHLDMSRTKHPLRRKLAVLVSRLSRQKRGATREIKK